MNQAKLLAQVKKMQAEMTKAQEELADTIVSGSAAGGLVTVDITCDQRVKRIAIAKEAADPEDIETLEDLVMVAVNDALAKAAETSAKRMASVTGGMRGPGLM
ncbi:MAG TPA: YbaB/EbfC family nucleoid-associated protein [Candidatus Cybelea sp.]|jgi:nucleoid-associated protein EbfC|nr:YbaB/EbfC family nucleoid-associated protein [Candidatus Cybelea sp.]